MKNTLVLFIVITLSACSSGIYKPLNIDKLYSSKLNGTWGCYITQPVQGVSGGQASIRTIYSYYENGKLNTSGSVTIETPEQNSLIGYYQSTSGTWNIKDRKLNQTMENIEIGNINSTSKHKTLASNSRLEQKISESSTILNLNNSEVLLKNDSDGLQFSCSKLHTS